MSTCFLFCRRRCFYRTALKFPARRSQSPLNILTRRIQRSLQTNLLHFESRSRIRLFRRSIIFPAVFCSSSLRSLDKRRKLRRRTCSQTLLFLFLLPAPLQMLCFLCLNNNKELRRGFGPLRLCKPEICARRQEQKEDALRPTGLRLRCLS